jgi:hypothetical protein
LHTRDATGCYRDYDSPARPKRAAEEHKRIGGEIKIIATVLDKAHKRQVEEIMGTLQEEPEGCTSGPLLVCG